MSTTTTATADTTGVTGERADLLNALANARHFMRYPARDLTDEQASTQTTQSTLTLGGLIKHVTEVEMQWQDFMVRGRAAMAWDGMDFSEPSPEMLAEFHNGFRMVEGQTLAGLLEAYAEAAARTDQLVRELDLDTVHELPAAPWFIEREWSVRRVVLHIIAETAQHCGHADIIRESLDGAQSMA